MLNALRDLSGCGFALNQRRIQEYFERRVAAVYDRYEVTYDGSRRGRDDAHAAWKCWECLFAFRVEKPFLLKLALHRKWVAQELDSRALSVTGFGRREILSVLLEAGATLNSAALAAGIVDKMRVFFAPKVAGLPRTGKRPGTSSAPERLRAVQELQNVSIESFGPDFAIEGYLRDVYRTR